MAVTNLFIARHGETEYNRTNRIQGRTIDEPLNEKGRNQSKAIARYLSGYGIDLAVSSDLLRSKQTAGIIADYFDVEIISFDELAEIHFGIVEGKQFEDIEQELSELHGRWKNGEVHFALEQGESPSQALNRVENRMNDIISKHTGCNIFFALHGRLIRILLSHWLGYGLPQMHRIKHSNGSLNHLRWDGENVEAVFLDKTEHLRKFFEQEYDS